jgi:hypothetical protein
MPQLVDGVLRWDVEDLNAGRCSGEQLWRRVNPEESPPVPSPPADALKDDIFAAYKSVGGPVYLQKVATDSPSQFLKLLSRLLPQAVELEVSGSLNVRQLSVAADRLFEVRRARGLCQAYPFTTVLPDGKRVVEVGALSPPHLALLSGQADVPAVPGQHFVVFEKAGDRWSPVEVRDAEFAVLEQASLSVEAGREAS